MLHAKHMIDLKQCDCRAPNGSLPYKHRPIPLEMQRPAMLSRVKKTAHFAGGRVDTGNIAALEAVIVETAKSEIRKDCLAMMFASNDVVDFKWKNGVFLRHLAIF